MSTECYKTRFKDALELVYSWGESKKNQPKLSWRHTSKCLITSQRSMYIRSVVFQKSGSKSFRNLSDYNLSNCSDYRNFNCGHYRKKVDVNCLIAWNYHWITDYGSVLKRLNCCRLFQSPIL